MNKTVQSKSTKIYDVLSTNILYGGDTLVGLFFKKGALEYVAKILDKYTYKEFPKSPF